MEQYLTIKESSVLTGVSESFIYKFIRQKKLSIQNSSEFIKGKFRTIKRIPKSELIKVFHMKNNFNSELPIQNSSEPEEKTYQKPIQNETLNNSELKENLRDILENFFEEKQSAIMKPMEQQALFLAGKYQAENEFLREQVETLRSELDTMKALPVEDMTPIKKENEKLKKQLSILPVEPEKIPELLKLEAERFASMEEKCIKEVQEKEYLESELKKLQQEAEDMRQKLSRPWWKIW